MKNPKLVKIGKENAKKRWGDRYEMLQELSKYVNKFDLNWLQAKWKTTHLERLLEAYKKLN